MKISDVVSRRVQNYNPASEKDSYTDDQIRIVETKRKKKLIGVDIDSRKKKKIFCDRFLRHTSKKYLCYYLGTGPLENVKRTDILSQRKKYEIFC